MGSPGRCPHSQPLTKSGPPKPVISRVVVIPPFTLREQRKLKKEGTSPGQLFS